MPLTPPSGSTPSIWPPSMHLRSLVGPWPGTSCCKQTTTTRTCLCCPTYLSDVCMSNRQVLMKILEVHFSDSPETCCDPSSTGVSGSKSSTFRQLFGEGLRAPLLHLLERRVSTRVPDLPCQTLPGSGHFPFPDTLLSGPGPLFVRHDVVALWKPENTPFGFLVQLCHCPLSNSFFFSACCEIKERNSHSCEALKTKNPPPHIAKRSAKSGEGPSVPESAAAGKATNEAAKALAHETASILLHRRLHPKKTERHKMRGASCAGTCKTVHELRRFRAPSPPRLQCDDHESAAL